MKNLSNMELEVKFKKALQILDDNAPHTLLFLTLETELIEIYASDSEEDILEALEKAYRLKMKIKNIPQYGNAETVKDLLEILNNL